MVVVVVIEGEGDDDVVDGDDVAVCISCDHCDALDKSTSLS